MEKLAMPDSHFFRGDIEGQAHGTSKHKRSILQQQLSRLHKSGRYGMLLFVPKFYIFGLRTWLQIRRMCCKVGSVKKDHGEGVIRSANDHMHLAVFKQPSSINYAYKYKACSNVYNPAKTTTTGLTAICNLLASCWHQSLLLLPCIHLTQAFQSFNLQLPIRPCKLRFRPKETQGESKSTASFQLVLRPSRRHD